MPRSVRDTGDRKQQANGAQQASDQGTGKERRVSGLATSGAKGGRRGVAGRRRRPLSSPGQTSVVPTAVAFLPGKSPLRSSRPHPGLCSTGLAPCAACLTTCCARPVRAAGGLHPQVPSMSLGRRVPALLSSPTLSGHSAPLPVKQLPLPICWLFCTTLQTWPSLPQTCCPALQLLGLPVLRKEWPETQWGLAAASW